MKTIASHVRKGAMAYLKQQYKVVTIVFVILAVVFAVMAYFNLQNGIVWFAFLTGGFFSGLAGFFGMKTATYASARPLNPLGGEQHRQAQGHHAGAHREHRALLLDRHEKVHEPVLQPDRDRRAWRDGAQQHLRG